MPGTAALRTRLQQLCLCRLKIYAHQKKRTRDPCKRKRQVFVYNPEEAIWHEPYMQSLRREFSDVSVLCDSKTELPWRDIALPTTGMRIRPGVDRKPDEAETDEEAETMKIVEKQESNDVMVLPWQDLLITETLPVALDDTGICDSMVEIPWADLALERPVQIRPPREQEQTCATDDVEIPWDAILVPRNIVIRPERKRKHPSSDRPPRPRTDPAMCIPCGTPVCCAKIRAKTRSKTHANNPHIAGSNWLLTCM